MGAPSAEDPVEIYTDGACSGNPGPGGWGAVMRLRGRARELSGFEARTTNNRMELLAAISAREAIRAGRARDGRAEGGLKRDAP